MYVAVNIYSRDSEDEGHCRLSGRPRWVEPDALIVADPAIFMQARKRLPQIPIHISTQANTTNTGTARFWRDLGPPVSTRPGN
jgi:putative protease